MTPNTNPSIDREWDEGISPKCHVREYPMTTCTQGEWHADYCHGHDSRDRTEWGYAEVIAGEEEAILRADRGTDEDIANVQMASASKDMYEALWVAVEHNALHFGESHNTVIQGRKALAKARGESHD